MQFYYGHQMPLRILDEAEFCKHQEEEHTVVIRELTADLEQKYVDSLKQWEKVLRETRHQVLRFIETVTRSGNYIPAQLHQHVLKLTSYYLQQSLDFIKLCEQIKTESEIGSYYPGIRIFCRDCTGFVVSAADELIKLKMVGWVLRSPFLIFFMVSWIRG